MGSPYGYAKIVVGANLHAIAHVYDEPRTFTRYNPDDGSPIAIAGKQTVIAFNGIRIPDQPVGNPVRNWADRYGYGRQADISKGTCPTINLRCYLEEKDARWKEPEWDREKNKYKTYEPYVSMRMIGIVAQEVKADYKEYHPIEVLDTPEIEKASVVFADMLNKLGAHQPGIGRVFLLVTAGS